MTEEPDDDNGVIPLIRDDPQGFLATPMVQAKRKTWDNPNVCEHNKKSMIVDRAARTIECGSCGAFLDPFESLFILSGVINGIEWKHKENREFAKKQRERLQKEHERRETRRAKG